MVLSLVIFSNFFSFLLPAFHMHHPFSGHPFKHRTFSFHPFKNFVFSLLSSFQISSPFSCQPSICIILSPAILSNIVLSLFILSNFVSFLLSSFQISSPVSCQPSKAAILLNIVLSFVILFYIDLSLVSVSLSLSLSTFIPLILLFVFIAFRTLPLYSTFFRLSFLLLPLPLHHSLPCNFNPPLFC